MQKYIIVSGASGLVATETIFHILQSCDYNLILLTRNIKKLEDLYQKWEGRVKVFSLEEFIRNKSLYSGECIHACIHTAFSRSTEGHSIAASLNYTKELAEICRNLEVGKFINISSQSVYGNDYDPGAREDAGYNPSYLYALGKYSTELISAAVFNDSKTKLYNLRLSSVCENARFMKIFVQNALEGKTINIVAPNQVVSFIDVRDVADALFKVIHEDKPQGDYNLGTGEWYTIWEVAKIVSSVGISHYGLENVNIEINDNGTVTSVGMNPEKFFESYNWRPKYNLEDMVSSLYEMLTDVNRGVSDKL